MMGMEEVVTMQERPCTEVKEGDHKVASPFHLRPFLSSRESKLTLVRAIHAYMQTQRQRQRHPQHHACTKKCSDSPMLVGTW